MRDNLILCSAIRFFKRGEDEFDFVLTGKRHHNCFETLHSVNGMEYGKFEEIQGFIDIYGSFFDRISAYKIALVHGQIKEKEDKRLFSEDLFKN